MKRIDTIRAATARERQTDGIIGRDGREARIAIIDFSMAEIAADIQDAEYLEIRLNGVTKAFLRLE